MLKTPLGAIKIYIDDFCTDYKATEFLFERPPCKDKPIASCYRIEVDARNCRSVACVVEPIVDNINNTGDSGEGYLNATFVKDNIILTIGMECDNPAFESISLPFGLQYNLNCSVDKVVFGIAWATDYEGLDDVRTWFAADPTL